MNRHAIPTALVVYVNIWCYQHIIATRLNTVLRKGPSRILEETKYGKEV